MNPNSNDNPSSESAHNQGGKIKGAAGVVHGLGLGDDFQVPMLGAVDALGNSGVTENGAAAKHDGGAVASLSQDNQGVHRPMGSYFQQYDDQFHDQYGAETSIPKTESPACISSDEGNAGASNLPHQPVSATNCGAQTSTYPSHHRDDAITGLTPSQLQEMHRLYHQQNAAPWMQTQTRNVLSKEEYGDSQPRKPVEQPAHPAKTDEMRDQTRQAMGQDYSDDEGNVHSVN